VIYLSGRAQAALRPNDVLVFDWVPISPCGCVGKPVLRTTTREAVSPATYCPLPAVGPCAGQVVAHWLGYARLVGRDIQIDCRRLLGVRRFSGDYPPDFGLIEPGEACCLPDWSSGSRSPFALIRGGAQ
jgi:hypothetical protein